MKFPSGVSALQQTFVMEEVEKNENSQYGPKKLSEESIASLILEMERNKKGMKPEDYVTSDFVMADKNQPKVYPVSARGQKTENSAVEIVIPNRKAGVIAANMPK